MPKTKVIPEKLIELQIRNYLTKLGWLVIKVRTTGRSVNNRFIPLPEEELGVADLIACSKDGLFHALEIKSSKGKLSDHQIAFAHRVTRAGGRHAVLRSLEDAIEYVRKHYP